VPRTPIVQVIYYQASYYYIGHLSKFVPEGSMRVDWSASNVTAPGQPSVLETTAFLTPSQTVVVVVMNPTDSAFNYTLTYDDSAALLFIPAHGIHTVTFPA
jgi:glucosylceramidase